jgi:hypothetical protein
MNDEEIGSQCAAECGTVLLWSPGQKWLRCDECGTLNYWPDGAHDDRG